MKTITVFGGSSCKEGSAIYAMAYRLGGALAQKGFTLCNGGYGGTMAAGAKGASKAGGRTVGITLASAANPWIQKNEPQPDHWCRMRKLMDMGDGYIILPGGTGTLAELGVLLESINKGLITHSPVLFLTRYWCPLTDLLRDEKILRTEGEFTVTEGVRLSGLVAFTEDPESGAEFLSANLLPSID